VLEACQVQHDAPCVLIASNDRLTLPADGSAWQTRNMARATYARQFDPDRIPAIRNAVVQRQDIAKYRLASGPKAAALHAWGHVFVVTGAASYRAAAEQALAACNAEPNRKGADGPCYLYALGNKVVLGKRMTRPPAPATTLEQAFGLVAPGANVLQNYLAESNNKAQAIDLESGRTFRWYQGSTKDGAEQGALESCQIRYGQPCVLLATNDELKAPDLFDTPRRDMPRVHYEGKFRLDMVPLHWSGKAKESLANYSSAKKHKAIAIRPNPATLFVVAGASSPAEAEKQALAGCNGKEEPAYPCFVYAVDDQVVLPRRRTEARK
jgi:hypothetical protein